MRPQGLRSACARAWSESGAWSPAALADALRGAALHVKRDNTKHFMYTAPTARSAMLLPDSVVRSAELTMSAPDFFDELDMPRAATPCTYFTTPVADIEQGMLLERAPGWQDLATSLADSDMRAARPWLQLWAASAGACTQAHYDVADNVFVQLHGQKEFLLWPPHCHEALHLFPDAHPRARKSMVCVARRGEMAGQAAV